jgi:glycosyltransferase involved in cell wall biosynthesis
MTGDTVGGVWTFTLDLAEALGEYGVEVVLATFGGLPSKQQTAQAARIPNLRLVPTEFRLEWMPEPWKDVEESGRWLMRLVEECDPDAVHLNSFGHGALRLGRHTVLTAHSCVLSWWEAVKGGRAPAEWDRYAERVRGSLHGVDLVTSPSRAMASALRKHYDFDGVQAIHNGRNAAGFHAAVKEPFAFTAGRLNDEAKNAGALRRIASKLSWPVYMAGEGTQLGRLGADEIAGWYARAAIYALPARYEPFGLSALEAALSGCALVLGDIPSLREVWGDTALFVNPGDDEELRDSIEMLIGDWKVRAEYARRCHARALTYRADTMARRYLDCYRAQPHRMARCAS